MDWQQIVTLSIVAVTIALFVRARWRRRTAKLPCGTYCTFASRSPGQGAGQSIIYHARKGERPEIIVKMR